MCIIVVITSTLHNSGAHVGRLVWCRRCYIVCNSHCAEHIFHLHNGDANENHLPQLCILRFVDKPPARVRLVPPHGV